MVINTVIGKRVKLAIRKSISRKGGFSLFELMIAMFILIILLSVAVPVYQRTVQHAKETVLKENLWQMRRSIEQYTADKGKLPASLDDLVESRYLREIPIDPILEKADWDVKTGPDPASPDGDQGVVDVKSLAEGKDGDGNSYDSDAY
jgi:general secretion pathway protein G